MGRSGLRATQPRAVHTHVPGDVDGTLEFLKRTRSELRILRMVRVWADRVRIFDVNGDYFGVRGVGYPDAEIVPILRAVHTAFDPATIHAPLNSPAADARSAAGGEANSVGSTAPEAGDEPALPDQFKEFKTGRRHPWAEDRLM